MESSRFRHLGQTNFRSTRAGRVGRRQDVRSQFVGDRSGKTDNRGRGDHRALPRRKGLARGRHQYSWLASRVRERRPGRRCVGLCTVPGAGLAGRLARAARQRISSLLSPHPKNDPEALERRANPYRGDGIEHRPRQRQPTAVPVRRRPKLRNLQATAFRPGLRGPQDRQAGSRTVFRLVAALLQLHGTA